MKNRSKGEVKYTEREEMIIGWYKALIKEKDEEISRLKCLIDYNASLDAKKMLSYDKSGGDIRMTFSSKIPGL